MANGGGTTPEIPSSLWNDIKDEDWSSGGWVVDGTQKWLHEKDDAWRLYGSRPPAGYTKAPMSESHWDDIAGGTLDGTNNWITARGTDYYIYYVSGPPAYSYTDEV